MPEFVREAPIIAAVGHGCEGAGGVIHLGRAAVLRCARIGAPLDAPAENLHIVERVVLVVSRARQAIVVLGGNLQLDVAGGIGPDHIRDLVGRPVRIRHVAHDAVQRRVQLRSILNELYPDVVVRLQHHVLGNLGLEAGPGVGGNIDAHGRPPSFHAEVESVKDRVDDRSTAILNEDGPPVIWPHPVAGVAIGDVGPIKGQGPLRLGGGSIHIRRAEVAICSPLATRSPIRTEILHVEGRERLRRAGARQVIEEILAAIWVLTLSSSVDALVGVVGRRRSVVGARGLVEATAGARRDIHTGLLAVTNAVHVGIHAVSPDADVVHPGLLHLARLLLGTVAGARDLDLQCGTTQAGRGQRITLDDGAIRVRIHQGLDPIDDGIQLDALSILEAVVVEDQRRNVDVEVVADVDAGAEPDAGVLVLVPIESNPGCAGWHGKNVEVADARTGVGPLPIGADVGGRVIRRGTERGIGSLVLEVLEIDGRRNRIAHHGHRGNRRLGSAIRVRDPQGHAVRTGRREVEAGGVGRVGLRRELHRTGEGAVVRRGVEGAVRRLQGGGSRHQAQYDIVGRGRQ